MNILNQEIQALQYTIEYYKKKMKKLDKTSINYDTAHEYYENRIRQLNRELEERLNESLET